MTTQMAEANGHWDVQAGLVILMERGGRCRFDAGAKGCKGCRLWDLYETFRMNVLHTDAWSNILGNIDPGMSLGEMMGRSASIIYLCVLLSHIV